MSLGGLEAKILFKINLFGYRWRPFFASRKKLPKIAKLASKWLSYRTQVAKWWRICKKTFTIAKQFQVSKILWTYCGTDPPENCHLTVKNCQKLDIFFKKLTKNVIFFNKIAIKTWYFFPKKLTKIVIFFNKINFPEGHLWNGYTWNTDTWKSKYMYQIVLKFCLKSEKFNFIL